MENKNCLKCKTKCRPAEQLINRLDNDPWVAAKALDFLYSICKGVVK